MKPAAACLPVALALASASGSSAMAQAAGDPLERLRACSALEGAERVKCLDRLSRELAPQPARPPTASGAEGTATPDRWIFSETTSPIDYSPIVIASAAAREAPDGSGMKLSVACRGGSTSLMLSGPGVPPAGGHTVSYAVDGGPPTTLAAAAATSGRGTTVVGDVVRLLVSLPTRGEIAFRIAGPQGVMLEGHYSLDGLRAVRERMAIPCRWPIRPDVPRR
jgi:hypothetical protein